jgi:hypothetical protein
MSRICGVLALARAVAMRIEAHMSPAASAIVIVARDQSRARSEWFIDLRRPEARTSLAAR